MAVAATAPPTRRGLIRRPFDVRVWPLALQMSALGVGLCAIAIIALTVMGYYYATKGLNAEAEAALTADGRLAVDQLDAYNNTHLSELKAFASFPVVQTVLQAGQTPKLTDILTLQGIAQAAKASGQEIQTAALARPDGSIVVDTDPVHPATTQPPSDPFRAAVAGHESIGGATVSPGTGQRLLYFAVPIKSDAGDVLGVMIGKSDLQAVDQTVNAAQGRVGSGAFGLLLDRDGLVIATTIDATWWQRPLTAIPADRLAALKSDQRWGGAPPPAPLQLTTLEQAVARKQQHAFNWNVKGTTYRTVVMPLQSTDWTYVVALPLSAYNAPASTFLRNAIVTAVVVLGIAVALTALFVTFLTGERKRSAVREQQLVRAVESLQVEIDEARRSAEVREITESEYFQGLTQKSRALRKRSATGRESTQTRRIQVLGE